MIKFIHTINPRIKILAGPIKPGIIFILIAFTTASCFQYPEPMDLPSASIPFYPGPEDMIEVNTDSSHYLLVSCSGRRDQYKAYGNIVKYDLITGKAAELSRIDEPKDISFQPHGIDFQIVNGNPFLYVINHDDALDEHPVIRYSLTDSSLLFNKIYHHPLLVSPNAVAALDDGSFFVCNDAGNRGSTLERILRLKRGNIIYYNNNQGKWKVVSEDLAYPAGLLYHHQKIYVSAALENKVYALLWDGEIARLKKPVMEITAPDNIRKCGNELIVTNHLNPVRFIRHTSSPENTSPCGVYSYSLDDQQVKLLYWNSGNKISAASTSLVIDNTLYMSQIFEPYLLKVELAEK